ncbi:MAG: hypothetical protein HOC91_15645 [Nitrospinaceae bacterium]|nr:hypothetical protein [Nitrospinaceae bacterium]MBT4431942.1 hypothetical protein [Nitrospinaceae bacterium]
MNFSEEEISRQCEALLGNQMDPAKTSGFAAMLKTLDQANRRVVDALEDASEPMGHNALLKGIRHGG